MAVAADAYAAPVLALLLDQPVESAHQAPVAMVAAAAQFTLPAEGCPKLEPHRVLASVKPASKLPKPLFAVSNNVPAVVAQTPVVKAVPVPK